MKTIHLAGLLGALLCCASHADELKLPQTSADYRKIAEDAERDQTPGTRGVVERVVVLKHTSNPGQHPSANDQAAESIADPNLVATPAIRTGAARPSTGQEYKVSVKWPDGKHQFFRVGEDPHLKKGDRVVLAQGKLVHVTH
ncbi:hypothetical protein [Niveibacterium sp. SC-1]|uniref:hypothetical protein n=1 Tax=Niveibacterium sp. SC-1 TaxID=3135646 RepID=UPI00311EF067